jgi:hypothetical protein
MNALDPIMTGYLLAWIASCVAAAILFVRDPEAHAIGKRAYWRDLAVPWKLATFAIAATGITLIAPYTGDPTWDYFDAAMMAILTFATAPWAVGALYLAIRGRASLPQAFVAACAWLLSASWCYDLYLLLRDASYPMTWSANLAASSILYLAAGLFWSLEWRPGRGATFGFLEPGWPQAPASAGFGKLVWFALPFMVLVTILIVQFVF